MQQISRNNFSNHHSRISEVSVAKLIIPIGATRAIVKFSFLAHKNKGQSCQNINGIFWREFQRVGALKTSFVQGAVRRLADVEWRSLARAYGTCIRRSNKYGVLEDRILCVSVANLYLTRHFTGSQWRSWSRSLDDEVGGWLYLVPFLRLSPPKCKTFTCFISPLSLSCSGLSVTSFGAD